VAAGLFYGHTGHVRFLTSVELGRSSSPADATSGSTPRRHATFSVPAAAAAAGVEGRHRYRVGSPPPLASLAGGGAASAAAGAGSIGGAGGMTLVVSGGDGFEDFRASSTDNESAGRDDSTNHLLLWRT